jgi:hypothetical protein
VVINSTTNGRLSSVPHRINGRRLPIGEVQRSLMGPAMSSTIVEISAPAAASHARYSPRCSSGARSFTRACIAIVKNAAQWTLTPSQNTLSAQ